MGRRAFVVAAMGATMLAAVLLSSAPAPASALDFGEEDLVSEEALWALYERWRGRHAVSRDLGDKARRFNVFRENVRLIHEFNQRDAPYKLRLNRFGDLTADEFRRAYAASRIAHHRMFRGSDKRTHSFAYAKARDLPPSVDWRHKGAVTAVKDQGQCGYIRMARDVEAEEGLCGIAMEASYPVKTSPNPTNKIRAIQDDDQHDEL
ncbi:hypothetical protein PR202_ga21774 [Eleusine coracana subsp. coracana]|uniref:Cathepsin propeptide inhibitor domain-containing protein n=1 Tax=Eleusine coracana subsp. coracana TaxID=191504 RepID=A0AAV5CZX7_ELECO|nr:hypothetical protein PR202_ga21774 [Eleusine coracana subsp. coracana]